MRAFTIPTIFTAVDRYSSQVRGMQNANRAFNSSIMRTAGSLVSMGAIVGGLAFSGKAIMDYETALASLQAITGLAGSEFETFKSKITEVAKATGRSSIEVTQAFTAIANNQPELLKNADALAAVTKSSILLAQAAELELKPAGEALTTILNQFGKGAADAAKTVDILAAGSVAGSSEIRDTAAAIQAFGTVAAQAGIKINESVALIELGSKFEKGAEAGVKFRNILLEIGKGSGQDKMALKDWKKAGINIALVTNKAIPLKDRLKEMSKILNVQNGLLHTFGKENIAMAAGLLGNIDKLGAMQDAVDTNGMAMAMAAKNESTFAKTLEHLKNKWITMVTTSDNATSGILMAKNAVKFLADHLDTVVKILTYVAGAFLIWKTLLIASRV